MCIYSIFLRFFSDFISLNHDQIDILCEMDHDDLRRLLMYLKQSENL
jgi:hypothetical protein